MTGEPQLERERLLKGAHKKHEPKPQTAVFMFFVLVLIYHVVGE